MKKRFTRCYKLLFVLVAFCSVEVSMGQIVYEEGFESGASDWLFYDGDNDGNNFYVGQPQFTGAGDFALLSYSTEFIVDSNAWFALSPINYAISPVIDLTSSVPPINLSYYHSSAPSSQYDREFYELRIVLVDSIPDIDSLVNDTVPGTLDSLPPAVDNTPIIYSKAMQGTNFPVNNEIDISDYVGEKIRLVYKHYTSIDQWYLLIDEIRVSAPIQYDASLVTMGYDNDYRYGQIPYFLLDSIPIYVDVTNLGERSFSGARVEVEGESGTPSYFLASGNLGARVDQNEVWRWRGNVGVLSPLPEQTIPVIRFSVDIDSTDEVPTNNEVAGDADNPLISTLANLSSNFYTTLDTAALMTTPIEEDPLDFGLEGIFYDGVNGPADGYQIVADRMTMLTTDIQIDPNTGTNNAAIVYGVRYDIKPSDKRMQVQVDRVNAIVSPVQSGAETWVEIYDYYNYTNTIGDTIAPIWRSDTMRVPFGFDDGKAHTLSFEFEDSLAPVLSSGKYIVAVVEGAHDIDGSIGLLGVRADRFNYDEVNSFMLVRDSEDNNLYNIDPDQLLVSGQNPIDFLWPISIYVSDSTGTGIKEVDYSSFVNVYPNPAREMINVAIDKQFKAKRVSVLDVAGRTVKAMQSINGRRSITIDLSDVENGLYFIEVSDGESKAVKKFIKQ